MKGIGITQWRAQSAGYPFPSSLVPGLFVDASFVLFDNEVPTLTSIVIDGTVTFNFTFGSFSFAKAACANNLSIQLRTASRYYGTLTFGEYADTVVSGMLGATLTLNTSFHGNTVRTINSLAGLYSIQGQHGVVNIETDEDIMVGVSPMAADSLSAISMPNAQKIVEMASGLYHWDNTTQFMSVVGSTSTQNVIDPEAVTGNFVSTGNTPRIDNMTVVTQSGTNVLIGASYDSTTQDSILYDCSVYPWIKFATIQDRQIVKLAQMNNELYALDVNGVLLNLGAHPYTSHPSVPNLAVSRLKNITSIADGTTNFLIGCRSNIKSSDSYFKINSSGNADPLGTFSIGGSTNVPGTHMLTSIMIDGAPYVALNSGTAIYLLQVTADGVNPSDPTLYGSALSQTPTARISVFPGPWSLNYTPVTPLRSINGVSANHIKLIGDNIITVNNTQKDEVTVSIEITDALTNIKRTQHYE